MQLLNSFSEVQAKAPLTSGFQGRGVCSAVSFPATRSYPTVPL
jgi:hypothetical protein